MDKTLPENVALEKASQSAFTKAMKTIKGLVQKGKVTVEEDQSAAAVTRKQRTKNRGVVHLSHIPHGFYEEQMTQFFAQFGDVTRLKVARSRKTGKSKGYAFVEFEHKEVAEIVAETMNNYLMFTKLVKAHYIPPEKFSEAIFFGPKLLPHNCPGVRNQAKNRRLSNRQLTDPQLAKRLKRSQAKLRRMQAKLDSSGIDYKIQLGGEAKFAAPGVSSETLKDDVDPDDVVEVSLSKGKKRKGMAQKPAAKKPRKSNAGKANTPSKPQTPLQTSSKTPFMLNKSVKKTPSKVKTPLKAGKTPSKVKTPLKAGKTPSKVQTPLKAGKTPSKIQTPLSTGKTVSTFAIDSAKKLGRKSPRVSTPAKEQPLSVPGEKNSPMTKKLATPKNVASKILTPKSKSKLKTPSKRNSMATVLSPTKRAQAK